MDTDNVTALPLDGNAFGRWLARHSVYQPKDQPVPAAPLSDARHTGAALTAACSAMALAAMICGLAYAAVAGTP